MGRGQEKENGTVEQHWRISLIDVTQVFGFMKEEKRKLFTSKT